MCFKRKTDAGELLVKPREVAWRRAAEALLGKSISTSHGSQDEGLEPGCKGSVHICEL